MSKRDNGRLPSAPTYPPRRNSYVLRIVAAVLCLVAVKDILYPKYLQASHSSLDDFQPLWALESRIPCVISEINIPRNSLSPVAEGGASDRDDGLDTVHFYMPSPKERAVVTTLYSESFATGVLALGHSLRAENTSARRILLYHPDQLTVRTLCYMQTNGWELHPVPHKSDGDDSFLKLQIWTLDKVGIRRVIYLANDALVRQNFDELWSLPFLVAAVPQVHSDARGFSPEFDTNMLLLQTSSTIYSDILDKINAPKQTRTVGFEGFLNKYFAAQVVRLPHIYNANLIIKRRSPELWTALTNHMRIVRYTVAKPFLEEERKRAVKDIWETEMEWWELTWQSTFKELQGRC